VITEPAAIAASPARAAWWSTSPARPRLAAWAGARACGGLPPVTAGRSGRQGLLCGARGRHGAIFSAAYH